LQLYSWTENKINTIVKKHKSKDQGKNIKHTKHTQNTLIETFKHKGTTD